jgi:molybdate transport system substrate-binding protein
MRRIAVLGAIGALLALTTPAPADAQSTDRPDTPVVAAASDLQFALVDVARAFTENSKREVKLAFGSSGNFFRQIQQGAPFQVYLSADEQFVFDLADKGFMLDRGALYAVGRIAIITPHGSPLKADGTLADLRAALADGRVRRFAIANPEHAPYGRRAEEALRHAGLWEAIKDKLVLGENVSQAAQFAASGNAQGGIVAHSLALAPDVAKLASHALIPEVWHEPLRQRMALVKGAGETARLFYAFMQGESARAIMRRHGFRLPGDPS